MKVEFNKISQNKPLLIAETACGHEGKIKYLKKLVDIAAYSKVKAVKFQIFTLKERSLPNTKEEKIFKNLVLDVKEWKCAIDYAHKKKLFVFADIFGLESFEMCQKLRVDGYKIHAEDTLNYALIEKTIKTKKIVILSVGASYRSEIKSLLDHLKNKNLNSKIILMAGFQIFPTPFESHSISEITDLKIKYSAYNLKIGFSDHVYGGTTESFDLPLLALFAGAEVIEKHFTINRKLKLTDYYSSLNPEELKNFNLKLKKYANLLKPVSNLAKEEKRYRKMFKKYPCIIKDKKIGETIKKNEIIYKKIKQGQSLNYNQIIKKKIIKNLKAGSAITLNHLSQKIGAVIVSRMTSKRFPGKALKKINGVESLIMLIRRIKKIKRCSEIILATSTDKSDDPLEILAKKENIKFFRGSLNNVASRFYEAAKKYSLDQILRITGDAIFCDEVMLEKAIEYQISKAKDVTFIKNMPYGTAKEVFNFKTIETISRFAKIKNNTEYLEWFLDNSRNFNVGYIKSNYKFNKKIRLTLDYKEDLIQLNKIFNDLKKFEFITLRNVIDYFKKNPNTIKINSHLTPKFKRIQINTGLNI